MKDFLVALYIYCEGYIYSKLIQIAQNHIINNRKFCSDFVCQDTKVQGKGWEGLF